MMSGRDQGGTIGRICMLALRSVCWGMNGHHTGPLQASTFFGRESCDVLFSTITFGQPSGVYLVPAHPFCSRVSLRVFLVLPFISVGGGGKNARYSWDLKVAVV